MNKKQHTNVFNEVLELVDKTPEQLLEKIQELTNSCYELQQEVNSSEVDYQDIKAAYEELLQKIDKYETYMRNLEDEIKDFRYRNS